MKKSEKPSHVLWLEFLHQKATLNSFKSISANSKCNDNGKTDLDHSDILKHTNNSKSIQYKSQEEYYDEIILLKKSIVTLKGENEILKSKVRQSDESFNKKDRELNEVIQRIEKQSNVQDSSIKNFVIIKKLQQNVFQLKSEIKNKETEILNIKNDLKNTKMNEIKIENEIFLQEIRSLQQKMSENSSSSNTKTLNSSNLVQSKLKAEKDKYKSVVKKNKELVHQNNLYKKEKKKLIQNEVKNMECLDMDHKKLYSDCDENKVEIDRLKCQLKEVYQEKNSIEKKYEKLSSKYNMLQDQYDNKLKEYEIMKLECDKLKRSHPQKDNEKHINETKLEKEKLPTKSSNITNLKIIQSAILSHFNRDFILQDLKKPMVLNKSEDIIASAVSGYMLRENIIEKK